MKPITPVKGPWIAKLTSRCEYLDGDQVDVVVENHQGIPVALTNKRNGALIASAPKMRAALERIAAGDGVYGVQAHEYKQIARAALGDKP